MYECFPVVAFAYLFHSLVNLYGMKAADAACLAYELYTANIDSFEIHHPHCKVREIDPFSFVLTINKRGRPYKTSIQLYKSIQALLKDIDCECLSFSQNKAVHCLKGVRHQIDWHFYKIHGLDIESRKTVYRQCRFHLIPARDEPEELFYATNRLICDIRKCAAS